MRSAKRRGISTLAAAILGCAALGALPAAAVSGQPGANACTIADYRHLSRLFIAIADTTEHCARALEHDDQSQARLCWSCRNAVSASATLRSWLASNPHCYDPYYQQVFRTSRALAQDVDRRCN